MILGSAGAGKSTRLDCLVLVFTGIVRHPLRDRLGRIHGLKPRFESLEPRIRGLKPGFHGPKPGFHGFKPGFK